MKAAILTRDGFEIQDRPVPDCGPGQVLVKMSGCGICGGEVPRFVERAKLDYSNPENGSLGHEGGGDIVAIGADVRDFKVGDAVTLCGGRFAEYVAIDTNRAVKLADTVAPAWSLGEPVACCVHAMQRCRIEGGESVAVIGCGFMGLICLELARILGAGRITALDPLPWRREAALDLGANDAMDPTSQTMEDRKNQQGYLHGEYDVVIEAAGNQPAIDLSGYLVKQHGLINIVGLHSGMRTVFMCQWNVKAIDVVNGHVRRHDEKMAAMCRGMEWAANGALRIEPLVTYYPLSRIQTAFEDTVNRKPGLIKAVIVPDACGI